MRMVRFTGVRATANDVVTTAHPSTVFDILDDITIEAQLIARVARALGFGGAEVEVPNLTEEDLVWLTSDGAAVLLADGGEGEGGQQIVLGHGNGAELGNTNKEAEDLVVDLGNRDEDLVVDLGNREEEDLVAELGNGEKGDLVGNACIKGKLGHGDGGVGYKVDNDGEKDPLSSGEGDWVAMKEEMIVAMLKFKMAKLRQAIGAAKSRAFITS